jgi:GntR family transcriptional regulator, histidine utilization repressor
MKMALHDRIRSDFEARILAGKLMPGDRLPIEYDLMAEYDCSRMTVNKALSALVAAGLIERRKRAGTFVALPRAHSMVLDVPDLAAETRGRGQTYEYRQLKRILRAANRGSEDERQLSGGGRLLQLDGLHVADGSPLAVERRLVSVTAVPKIVDAAFGEAPPGTWLLQHIPWTEAETRISAVPASASIAKLLKVPVDTACLCIDRQTWRKAERITHVQQTFRGDAYDLVARFGPSIKNGIPVKPSDRKSSTGRRR